MDAVNFIREKERMCKTCGACRLCPAYLDGECIVNLFSGFAPEQQVNTVKVWAEQHPIKTRQSVFLEQYPQAHIDDNGVLWICPSMIVRSHRRDGGGCANSPENCPDCRRKFWLQAIE